MMTKQTNEPWYEQDEFWDTIGPVIFDRQRYDLAPGETENLITLLDLAPGRHICDLCCGVGRHSRELARRGFAVTGVDRTERYLEQAGKAAQAEGLEIEFVHEDMRDFCRPETFDVVLNLFTSFGYFDAQRDNRRVLENVHRSLRANGQLLIDMIGKEIAARIFEARTWRPVDGGMLLEERKILDDWSWIESRWILIRDGQQYEWTFAHSLYSAAELRELLESCGFQGVRVYGSLAGTPYDEKAERLVIVGRK